MSTARPTIRTTGGDRLNSLLRQLRTQRGKAVSIEVGFFESARYEDGTSVPTVAAIHQFGAPNRNIPARPYFTNAMEHIEREVRRMVLGDLRQQTRALGTGGAVRAPRIDDGLLNQIGAKAAGIIQQSIVDISRPPLSQKTIEARRNRGKGKRRTKGRGRRVRVSASGLGPTPLIDTGFLRRSVTWKVRS